MKARFTNALERSVRSAGARRRNFGRRSTGRPIARSRSLDVDIGYTEGLTGNYLKVQIAGELPPNQWCDAEIQSEQTIVANREEVAINTI